MEKVQALDEFDRPHPVSTQAAVATLKKYLSEERYRIHLRDFLIGEANEAQSTIDAAFPHDHGVEVSLTDYDVERFDPREVAPVDVDAPLDDRAPGGLGLYLVLKMVDSIHYEYRNRQSKITFIADRK